MKITINGHEFSWPSLWDATFLEGGDNDYVVVCAKCGGEIDNPRDSDVQKACEGKCVYCSDDCEREAQRDDAEALRADEQFHKGL